MAGCVNDRDASILVVRYGLVTGVPMTQAEVGKVFNIGPGRISSLERRAVRQLSFGMRKHLEEFLELHVDELLKNGHHSVEELDQGDQHNLSMWLKNHDVYTIEQLTELTEAEVLHVFSFHAMGLGHQGSVDNVKEQLASRGLKLKDV